MGKTLAEKILANSCGRQAVTAGEIITAHVDTLMMDDALGPWYVDKPFQALGGVIANPKSVIVISDHLYPAGNVDQAENLAAAERWCEKYKVDYVEGQGPCHQILAEMGYDMPGTVLVGTDSHTCTSGAFGCFGTGIGSTEAVGVLYSGTIWMRVPESILVEWTGALPRRVMAKDMMLKTIGALGHAGATYMAVEFAGDTIRSLPMDERMCISNMAVETGAKVGLIAADDTTMEYLGRTGSKRPYHIFESDADAVYYKKMKFCASDLVPQVACPHFVDNVHPIEEVAGLKMHQAYIGSCTGARLYDLQAAAEILKGRHVANGCRLLISPSSTQVYRDAMRLGLLDIFMDAGAMILAPSCGACAGLHSGILAAGERCVSTTNRNFKGRMGSLDSELYLASPATVAASAIEGALADPRNY